MKTHGEIKRIKWDYPQFAPIPEEFRNYLWEYQNTAPLELIILRVLTYGSFKEIQKLFSLYPEETTKIAFKYPEIKRGIKFWIKRWKNS
ncbi:MAG: hypothetical protein OD816_001400 [Thermodesulfobacterium sp.]|uniref:Uncharacterized protein n=1 Tax=Candidatus Thermodesulfobacterium syntrophicum TaxID=3060442 RepID=A0AAE3P5G9_9BACT|nr:hypothetical protein [Candidatus Thermodesulfobacterium syntrophicum]